MYDQMQFKKIFGPSLALIFIIFSTIPIKAYSYDGFSVTKNDTAHDVSNSSKVLVNITFDSLFINNDKNLFGKGLWNFSVDINDKSIDLLVNEKVDEGQTVKFNGKNTSFVMPISDTLYLFSQPYYIQKSGKIGILDWISETIIKLIILEMEVILQLPMMVKRILLILIWWFTNTLQL
jgi:hypothetical protein